MLHKRGFTQVRLKVILYTASEEGTCIKLVTITSTSESMNVCSFDQEK